MTSRGEVLGDARADEPGGAGDQDAPSCHGVFRRFVAHVRDRPCGSGEVSGPNASGGPGRWVTAAPWRALSWSMVSTAGLRGRVRAVSPVFALLVPLAVSVWLFGRYVCDDDLIMLRYAQRLAEGRGLTWNDGERVHGISAGLLVLLSAGLRVFGVPLEVTMRLLSSAGVLASGVLVVVASRRAGVARWWSFALGGALVLAAPFAVWVFAGVGGAVFAAVAGWAVLLASDPGLRPAFPVRPLAVLLVLLQVVRPDALVLVVPVLLVAFLASRGAVPRRAFVLRLLVPVFGFAVLFAFVQWSYFATPVPHLAGVKTVWGFGFVRVGLLYVLEFLRGFAPLVAVVPLLIVFSSSRRSFPVLAPLLPAAVWLCYVVWIGGDWMPGNRHFAVVVLLVYVSAVRAVSGWGVRRRLGLVLLLGAASVSSVVSVSSPAATRAHDATRWLEVTCDGAEELSTLVGSLDPLLGVEPAGCPPYVTGMRSLDLLGLNDLHVSRASPTGRPVSWDEWVRMQAAAPEDLARSFIPGHGNGDGTYVWEREPDLLVGCNPPGSSAGCFRSFFEMQERFDFASRYRPLVLETSSGDLWHAWVRFDAGPLGVRVLRAGESTTVVIPVWLLAASPSSPLRVRAIDPVAGSSGGRIDGVVTLPAAASLDVPPLRLTEGTWALDGLPGSFSVSSLSSCASFEGPSLVVSSPGCEVLLRVVASSPAEIREVSLRLR